MDSVTQTIQAAMGRQPEMQEPLISRARKSHSQPIVDVSLEEVDLPILPPSLGITPICIICNRFGFTPVATNHRK